ncbi:MAG: hypothetical protein HOM55_05995 [Proteobacteria bacterium]|jgi:hypothetical protein|nr:hypothetical protein [Pseudomonadota bacterium]
MSWVERGLDQWGQEVLVGVSWDLLPWFFGVAAAIIVLHFLYASISKK